MSEQLQRFWRWWIGELRECVPARIVHWLRRLRVSPLVLPEVGGFSVYRFDGAKWLRTTRATGETPEVLAKVLGAQLRKVGIDRFAVGLLPGQFLAKTITVPQAAEENLRNALRYELDRHTPFKPDDVGFDCCVVGRDENSREIAVNLVIAQKSTISAAVAAVAGTGLLVTAVQPGLPDAATLPINLLPHDDSGNGRMQRFGRWLPWALLGLIGLTAVFLPLYQKRNQVIELQPQVNIAAQQAQSADVLHQQLDRAQAEYNFLLQKRYATPTSLQLLSEVTRILPDDTWLQSFELRTTSKGRELQLQGETGVSGKMIELFEQSPLLTGASFKSPVTQAAGSLASRFHLGIDVKEVPPPVSRPLAPTADATAPGTAATASVTITPPAAIPPGAATPAVAATLPPAKGTSPAPVGAALNGPVSSSPAVPASAIPAQVVPAPASPTKSPGAPNK